MSELRYFVSARAEETGEKCYPEKILKYTLSGLGKLDRNAERKEYTRKAEVMVKARRMLVDVLGDEARWVKFALKIKKENLRRPASQRELSGKSGAMRRIHEVTE